MKGLNDYQESVNHNKIKAELDPRKTHTYDLQIYKDDFRFTLSLPPNGEVIEDDFEGLIKRKAFYMMLENGEIYDWICEIQYKILK
jgi:hypothetical protein